MGAAITGRTAREGNCQAINVRIDATNDPSARRSLQGDGRFRQKGCTPRRPGANDPRLFRMVAHVALRTRFCLNLPAGVAHVADRPGSVQRAAAERARRHGQAKPDTAALRRFECGAPGADDAGLLIGR
jgi:hypothetical protein